MYSVINLPSFISVVRAAGPCDVGSPGTVPGGNGINLTDCFALNEKQNVVDVYKDPATLINMLVPTLFLASGFICLGMIMFAGFQAITGGTKGLEQAKKILVNALIGFVVMFAAYWIVQIVKIFTGAAISL